MLLTLYNALLFLYRSLILDTDVQLYTRVFVRFSLWLSNIPSGTNGVTEAAFKEASPATSKWFDWQYLPQCRWNRWKWTPSNWGAAKIDRMIYNKLLPLSVRLLTNCRRWWQDLVETKGKKRIFICTADSSLWLSSGEFSLFQWASRCS